MFAGINSVVFDGSGDNDALCIIAMKSLDGEMVPLSNPVDITVPVEVEFKLILSLFISYVLKSMHKFLRSCLI